MRREEYESIDIENIGAIEGWDDSRRACDYESPFPVLIRAEVRRLQRKCKLTERQSTIFELYVVDGLSITEIAGGLSLDISTAREHLESACRKANGVKGCGALTVLMELVGTDAETNQSNWYKSLRRMLGREPKNRG